MVAQTAVLSVLKMVGQWAVLSVPIEVASMVASMVAKKAYLQAVAKVVLMAE